MGHPVIHFEIGAKDSKKIQNFYSKLFDWKIDGNNPQNYGMVTTKDGSVGIDGGIFQVDDKTPPYVAFYVGVDDPTEYLNKAVELGGKIIIPETPIPGVGHFGMFLDPENNCIGVINDKK